MAAAIPDHLHFVWIGPKLPWFARLAVESATRACTNARVSLWASHALERDPNVLALQACERFEVRKLDEQSLFADADPRLPVDLLARLFRELDKPAARSNIARLLILARFGGVYLDTDTVTFRDLSPLRALGAFCGLEHVVWPVELRYGVHPYRVLGGPYRDVMRAFCAFTPRGDTLFDRVAHLYQTAANNAVLGFGAGHPFLLRTLRRVDELSERERMRRYRLGTHLLQEALAGWGDEYGVVQLPPSHFYPLGPEISRHYFRRREDLAEAAARIIGPETYLVHWYASVSQLAHYDDARVRAEAGSTLFARLSARALGWPIAGT